MKNNKEKTIEQKNIKYLVNGITYLNSVIITQVEIEKETEHSVQIKNKNGYFRKITNDSRIFDSWKEAHAFTVQKAKEAMEYKQMQYQRSIETYKKIKNMKEEKE